MGDAFKNLLTAIKGNQDLLALALVGIVVVFALAAKVPILEALAVGFFLGLLWLLFRFGLSHLHAKEQLRDFRKDARLEAVKVLAKHVPKGDIQGTIEKPDEGRGQMMEAETAAVTTALLGGLVVGGGLSLWRSAREQDEKCEFLRDVGRDVNAAFADADILLDDSRVPPALRATILVMLSGFVEDELGRRLARSTFLEPSEHKESNVENNLVSVAMRELAEVAPGAERTAHRTLAALSMGLLVVHFGDGLSATRVQRELASDPTSVWSKIGETVGITKAGDHDHAHA